VKHSPSVLIVLAPPALEMLASVVLDKRAARAKIA
jgi:hypothetical protein